MHSLYCRQILENSVGVLHKETSWIRNFIWPPWQSDSKCVLVTPLGLVQLEVSHNINALQSCIQTRIFRFSYV